MNICTMNQVVVGFLVCVGFPPHQGGGGDSGKAFSALRRQVQLLVMLKIAQMPSGWEHHPAAEVLRPLSVAFSTDPRVPLFLPADPWIGLNLKPLEVKTFLKRAK